ncbi:GlcG/HbpS family heme-binding protein [Polymorphum gilvum]|uniref:Conserved domain protein n=1 Tax=Polymorphum gilvum (strain LMG 25793 / CGMCC 1.9160 / SL003B-26A1) TaxID=991905 RepID=F2J0A4_POLGS|nr:heme-binding protein [Polymorphum gilvum]ADZ68639.1 Conserved domain protein [Polymorphum gilvum SL003B-26A1]
MSKLTLSMAQTMVSAALAKAADLGLKPLTVAVMDAGGHLVALARQDGSSIMRPQIASGKAFGALAMGTGTRWLNANAETRPHFVQALNGVAGGAIVPVAGGVLVKSAGGEVLGAIGVTGDSSDNDEICALAGIAAVGLVGDCG